MPSKIVLLLALLTLLVLGIVDIRYHGHFSDGYYEKQVQRVLRKANYNTAENDPIRSPVHANWVTLNGTVSTKADRDRVADAVQRQVPGLVGVTNNLTVPTRICAREVLESLKILVDSEPDDSKISYLVSPECNVTLTGWVPTKERKAGVGRVASSTPGVGEVANNIEVGYPAKKLQDTLIEILRVQNIYFDFNKATIRAESLPALDKVAQALNDNPGGKVRIEGHTDAIAGDAYNQDLSERRAAAVRQALVERGVPGERLEAMGHGEAKPIAANDTPEGRADNRRIEFKVL